MKKTINFFVIIILFSLFTTSCNSRSGHKLEEKRKKADSATSAAIDFVSKKDSIISFVPTDIGITKLQIEKVEGECADTAGKNEDVSFMLYIKDSAGQTISLPFHDWDCNEEKRIRSKKVKDLYSLLFYTKKSDVVVTAFITAQGTKPSSVKVIERWKEGKADGPSTVEPATVVWDANSSY